MEPTKAPWARDDSTAPASGHVSARAPSPAPPSGGFAPTPAPWAAIPDPFRGAGRGPLPADRARSESAADALGTRGLGGRSGGFGSGPSRAAMTMAAATGRRPPNDPAGEGRGRDARPADPPGGAAAPPGDPVPARAAWPRPTVDASTHCYETPSKKILSGMDLRRFRASEPYGEFCGFVLALGDAARGRTLLDPVEISGPVAALMAALDTLETLVERAPPTATSLRYGNPSFRTWWKLMQDEAEGLMAEVVGEPARVAAGGGGSPRAAQVEIPGEARAAPTGGTPDPASLPRELAGYLAASFGDPTRIDYGTGHETSFVSLLFCLAKTAVVSPADAPALVLRAFARYVKLCRRLQSTYWLEPAGSRGVWGLDDYQCLAFFFGSSQMLDPEGSGADGRGGAASGADEVGSRARAEDGGGTPRAHGEGRDGASRARAEGGEAEPAPLSPPEAPPAPAFPRPPPRSVPVPPPRSIADDGATKSLSEFFIFFAAVRFVRHVKKGPLHETSPMLTDISRLPTWAKIQRGLWKLYEAEVLGKFPIMQHFLFGSLLVVE